MKRFMAVRTPHAVTHALARSPESLTRDWRSGLGLLLAVVVSMCGALQAHHSFTLLYDPDELITVRGRVAEFHYRNPHIMIIIDEIDDSGQPRLDQDRKPVRWTVEALSVRRAERRGMRQDALRPGQIITVRGWVSRRSGVREMGASQIIQESGHVFVSRPQIGGGGSRGAAPYPGAIPAGPRDP